jgi:hypothetical protein
MRFTRSGVPCNPGLTPRSGGVHRFGCDNVRAVSAQRLAEVLGGVPPESVTALPEADRAALVEVIEAALARQADDLAASFDTTLRHVPFPLRAVVRKVLIG